MTSTTLMPVILLATALFGPLHVASIRRRRIQFEWLNQVPEADLSQVKNYIATHPIAEAKQPVSNNNNSDVRYRVHFGQVPANDDGSLVESVMAYRVFTRQGDTGGQWQMAEDEAANEKFLLPEHFSTNDEAVNKERSKLWRAILRHPLKDNHRAIEPYYGNGRLYAIHIDDDQSNGNRVIGYERSDNFYFYALLKKNLEDLEFRLDEYADMSNLDQLTFRGHLGTEDFRFSGLVDDFVEYDRRLNGEVNSEHHAYSVYQHSYHARLLAGGQPLPLNKALAYVKYSRAEQQPESGMEGTGGVLSTYYFQVEEFKVLSDVNRAQVALLELRMAKDFVEWVRKEVQTGEKGYGILIFVDPLMKPASVRWEKVFNKALKQLGYSGGLQRVTDPLKHQRRYIDFVSP